MREFVYLWVHVRFSRWMSPDVQMCLDRISSCRTCHCAE